MCSCQCAPVHSRQDILNMYTTHTMQTTCHPDAQSCHCSLRRRHMAGMGTGTATSVQVDWEWQAHALAVAMHYLCSNESTPSPA